MTWEWDSHSTPHRWALTVGPWNALVQRSDGPRHRWCAVIEHAGAPDGRLNGPSCSDAMVARTWCLAKIAELQAKRPGA